MQSEPAFVLLRLAIQLRVRPRESKMQMVKVLLLLLLSYYTVSFSCNIHFLNSTYFIFNQFKSNKFSRFFCCWVYFDREEDILSQINFIFL